MVIATLATGWLWLTIPLCYGFWARLLTGPTLSPLGWLAMDVVAPRLGERRSVPGPPKRFAQAIGTVLSSAALVLGLLLHHHLAADVVLAMFIPAAGLEAGFGYCLGCKGFGLLMALGVVPADVCAECADVRLRWDRAGHSASDSTAASGPVEWMVELVTDPGRATSEMWLGPCVARSEDAEPATVSGRDEDPGRWSGPHVVARIVVAGDRGSWPRDREARCGQDPRDGRVGTGLRASAQDSAAGWRGPDLGPDEVHPSPLARTCDR